MKPHIEVRSKNHWWKGESHWIAVVAANGQPMLTSEMFSNKSNAARAARDYAETLNLKIATPLPPDENGE